ncbi:MAG: hypothetical protein ACFFDN_23015 [Candidatus Hodarchaeota archaeon]
MACGENLFVIKGKQIGKLVAEKNKAYGDSFLKTNECLFAMFPEGIKPYQYKDLLYIIRVLDKLFRIATEKEAFGENPK